MFWSRLGEFLPHEQFVADPFYAPARDGVERGRPQRFPSAQAETGVMQRTSHCIPNDEALRQHSVVVSAVCANRQKFVPAAHQDHVFAACLTERHCSVGKVANEKSISKVAFLNFFLVFHVYATSSL